MGGDSLPDATVSEKARIAIQRLSGEWQAGPNLPESVTSQLYDLQQAGLVERDFGDMRAPEYTSSADELTVRMAACWHFRLTDAGLAAKTLLSKDPAP